MGYRLENFAVEVGRIFRSTRENNTILRQPSLRLGLMSELMIGRPASRVEELLCVGLPQLLPAPHRWMTPAKGYFCDTFVERPQFKENPEK